MTEENKPDDKILKILTDIRKHVINIETAVTILVVCILIQVGITIWLVFLAP